MLTLEPKSRTYETEFMGYEGLLLTKAPGGRLTEVKEKRTCGCDCGDLRKEIRDPALEPNSGLMRRRPQSHACVSANEMGFPTEAPNRMTSTGTRMTGVGRLRNTRLREHRMDPTDNKIT